MKTTRLDKIINDNVTFSTKKTDIQQAVYILQDISETLAMIYDKMNNSEEENLNGEKFISNP